MSPLGKKISIGLIIVLIVTAAIGCGATKKIAKVDTTDTTETAKVSEAITILGLVPGMDKDEAIEKMKSYGFVDQTYTDDGSSYYYVTGDNGGSYGIYLGVENGKVTNIGMHGRCSYAG